MFPQGGILEYFYIESNSVFHFSSSDSIKDKFTQWSLIVANFLFLMKA